MNEKRQPARWYVVGMEFDGVEVKALVQANAPAQAFRRFAQHHCVCRPATANDVIEMTRLGCDVISAPSEPEQLDIIEDAPQAEPALTPDKPLGVGPLEPDRLVSADTAAAEKAGSSPAVPGLVTPPKPQKAASVFGAGFGPKAEPDVD